MKINWKKISTGILVTLALFVLGTMGSHAVLAIEYTPLAPLPGIEGAATSNLPEYLVALFRIILGLAAVLAVIQITIGGVQYMSTDAISGKEDGKERITQAIYGLILAIGAWLILFTVNPRILTFTLNPTPIEAPSEINTTAPRLGSAQKIKTCKSTTNNDALPDIRTIHKSIPYNANDPVARKNALDACRRTPPSTPIQEPEIMDTPLPGECDPGYDLVTYMCVIDQTPDSPTQ